MKNLFIIAIMGLLYCPFAHAQMPTVSSAPIGRRTIRFNFIAKDSIREALNEDFDMIEDSCSVIIRHGKLNVRERKYFGKFTDVSKLDPNVILTEGNYTANGLKDGYFITHYLNGQLQAKGTFKNNEYDGKWELYYDNGKPKLFFEASGKDIKIIDAWDEKGAKYIDNGKGAYRVDMGQFYWKGKLLNGHPDGSWASLKTDDATNEEYVTEKYKNGAFQKGSGPMGAYNDASRLILVPNNMLPFTRAELMFISAVPCGGTKRKHLVGAQYQNGLRDFTDHIAELSSQFLRTVNLEPYDSELVLEGQVNTDGGIANLTVHNAFSENIARGLISQLRRLPPLQPATADGKPVIQKFTITYTFSRGQYSFTYRFLPVQAK